MIRRALALLLIVAGSPLILVGAWWLFEGPRGDFDWPLLGIYAGGAIGIGLALVAAGIVAFPRRDATRP